MNAATALDNEIVQCLPRLSTKQKKTVLTVVKTLVEQQADWWDGISEAQQKAIEKSLAEMKAGKLTPHHKVMQKYKK
jgi:predicted transcriptional regulator